jgi:hypothetical protein
VLTDETLRITACRCDPPVPARYGEAFHHRLGCHTTTVAFEMTMSTGYRPFATFSSAAETSAEAARSGITDCLKCPDRPWVQSRARLWTIS